RPPTSTLFPYTTLFRSFQKEQNTGILKLKPYAVLGQFSQKSSFLINDYESLLSSVHDDLESLLSDWFAVDEAQSGRKDDNLYNRSEEHTSELQSRENLV